MNYETLNDIFIDLAQMLRPPERLTVSGAAAKYRRLNNANAYVGPWLNSMAPYMVEPMDVFASRFFDSMAFVGPAQCGKTDGLILNTAAYSIKVDPMDTMIVCPTNTAARDFSMRRIDRLHQHSPEIGKMMLGSSDADNKFDKQYTTGMILSISWPTPTELAGKPIGRVILTDRDRMPDSVGGAEDGDGEPFDLAKKRTTTFGSNAMTVAESSPSRDVKDRKWIPATLHEAPPAGGIIGLYNRGDRRRWYWGCPHCDRYFEGRFEMLNYDRKPGMSNYEAGLTARMECPHCESQIHPDNRYEMNLWGMWVKDGQAINKFGNIFGPAPRTKMASFWLRGVAAAFVTWSDLVMMYLDAMDSYDRTRSEEALKKFYNNDLGEPYYSKLLDEVRVPETLKSRADKVPEHLVRHVPEGVRFLVAQVDVQKNMFVVQVKGIMPGTPFDIKVIDRFEVKYSKRLDENGERIWVKPAVHLDDWKELVEHVMQKEYPLADGSGRMMGVRLTGCDSGGKAGVTGKAYDFYRYLRDNGLAARFVLLKGDPKVGQPRTRVSFPDSQRKDMKSAARGDIPILMLNSNLLKDDLNGRLDCLEPGKGMCSWPDWLPLHFYQELCAEIRTADKGWEHVGQYRNEAWDLFYYAIGMCISKYIQIERIDWNNPPGWAAPWDENDLVRAAEQESSFTNGVKSRYDFAALGKSLA